MAHTVCVATEYGEILLEKHPLRQVHCGRMDREEIRKFILEGGFAAVVDATHPYAEAVTENVRSALEGTDIPYLRLLREQDAGWEAEGTVYFTTHEEAMRALEKTEGNILLTTGSKELETYCASEGLRSRLFVRVLPSMESYLACAQQGIQGKQIIAMQGPFTTEMNEAVIRQYGISCLVTKQSGKTGGYGEKLEAARRAGIPVYVIGRPGEKGSAPCPGGEAAAPSWSGTFSEVCEALEDLCGCKLGSGGKLRITLAGAGMGAAAGLTREAEAAIRNADILLGAQRLLRDHSPRVEKRAMYRAEEIIPYLRELQEQSGGVEELKVVILFSGDSGFYSGCGLLQRALEEEMAAGRLRADIRVMPGVSSVSYLAACTGESYQDAAVYSMHGKRLLHLAAKLRRHQKTYLLMSGVKDVNRLGELLMEAGMTDCRVVAGCGLSYPDQQIRELTPEECCYLTEEGLYTCLVKNPNAKPRRLTHGIPDEAFIRDRVPMTKEEVREVSICKLRLHEGAVVYDIGSGTGSVAAEMAGLSDDIAVYAVEQKPEARSLLQENMEKLRLENVHVTEGEAPEALAGLPPATHAFIGGSGGRLREILTALYEVNPHMRVVINAVSLETISELKEMLSLYPVCHEEIVQLQVSRTRQAGRYHLMQAENPVWICAFDFEEKL